MIIIERVAQTESERASCFIIARKLEALRFRRRGLLWARPAAHWVARDPDRSIYLETPGDPYPCFTAADGSTGLTASALAPSHVHLKLLHPHVPGSTKTLLYPTKCFQNLALL
jgi:hypothetical protein